VAASFEIGLTSHIYGADAPRNTWRRTPDVASSGGQHTHVIEIRQERSDDLAAVRDLHRRAFGQEDEGKIVDALRANGGSQVSLVAVDEGRVVGHILYSPVRIGQVEGSALGPMAVDPEVQRQGIGTELVEAGNARLRENGCPFVVVVGHPEFYPRFGFKPARPLGITCEWEVPDEVFMILVLDETTMSGVTGKAEYRREFGE
jgi:putative acetyltransferase